MGDGKRAVGGHWRRWGVLLVALALALAALGTASAPALAQGSGYYVTFVARSCPAYTDIFANKQRNDILESLMDLGPNSQYLSDPSVLINPAYEEEPPQDACTSLPAWRFTLGTGYESRAVTGAWGSLSKVTDPFDTSIQTQDETPLLDEDGVQVDDQDIAGATTIELTAAEREQASNPDELWAQGGVPDDPVLTSEFGGEYAFGALRCATDDLNGDNVEYIYFPTGVRHVFCYGLYVRPAPTSGLITIEKHVTGAPAGENPSFPFNGTISYDPNGFQLADGGSLDFYRAGGSPWDVTEGSVPSYRLASLDCTAVASDGGPGQSTTTISGGTAAIHLVAGEHVTCVYDNTYVPPTGNLTIDKITRDGVGSFGYTVTHPGGPDHHLTAHTTEEHVPATAAPALPDLEPGAYTIHEHEPVSEDGHWRSVSVDCDGTHEPATRPVHVEIASGVHTTCTFVNEFIPRGSISLAKTTYGATGTVAFLIGPHGGPPAQFLQHATTTSVGVPAAAVPNTPADATDHLHLGHYLIAEQAPPSDPAGAWALTSVDCNGLLQPFDTGFVEVHLTLHEPSVHCVFSDTFTPHPPPPPPEPPTPPLPPPPIPPTPPSPPPVVVPPDALPAYALSDLAVSKQTRSAVAVRGHAVAYRITIKNHGPDPAQRVALADQPLGRADIVSVHTPVGSCRRTPHLVCQLGTLKAGRSVVVTVILIPTGTASHFTNRAVVGTATNERTLANNTAQATIRVIAPAPPPPVGRG